LPVDGRSGGLKRARNRNENVIAGRVMVAGDGGAGVGEWDVRPAAVLHVVVAPPVSARARARGLYTVESLKREVLTQRATWWQGNEYHCPLCDVNFGAAQSAAEHVVREQHPVLRMD
jgi:hypothetical protein